jgi:hypothetical protein
MPTASRTGWPLTLAQAAAGGVVVDTAGNVYLAESDLNRTLQLPPGQEVG